MYRILTNKVISNGQLTQGETILVDGSRIIDRGTDENLSSVDAEVIDCRSLTLLPGFIDIHTHGAMGYDVMDGTYEALEGISTYKLEEGCTSICPTTITAPMDKIIKAVENIHAAKNKKTTGAKLIGAFLEGPYINPKFKGAHPENYILPPKISDIKRLIESGKGCITSFAIAPELPGAIEIIKYLKDTGVQIRLGHSDATYAEVENAITAGANLAIHTYNQMSPLHHREPGMVGAILTKAGLAGEVICDLVHTHPAAVKILIQAKGSQGVVLVTDSMAATGLADGEYKLGELTVNVEDGISRIANGALAGSTTSMIECVRNMHQVLGLPLEEAVQTATVSPAKMLGMYNEIGSLDIGKSADIIGVDSDLNIKFVMIDGEIKKIDSFVTRNHL